MGPREGRDDDETTAPEPHPGLQGEGGPGCRKGREDAGRTGPAVRRACEPDHDLEGSAPGRSRRGVRFGAEGGVVRGGREDAPRRDRRADAHQRFFVRRARQGRPAERKAMIDRDHDLPITKQARALGISRGSVYCRPRPVSAAALAVTRRMDELHLEFPFAGSRMLRDLLNKEGVEIGRRRVATLMRRMGIEALYRKPDTSKPAPGHKIYPYLLRGMTIDRPNQVRAMDLTYVPMVWRVKRNLRLPREARLADGSYLTTVYPSEKDRRHRTDGVRVRVVEYRLEGVADA